MFRNYEQTKTVGFDSINQIAPIRTKPGRNSDMILADVPQLRDMNLLSQLSNPKRAIGRIHRLSLEGCHLGLCHRPRTYTVV